MSTSRRRGTRPSWPSRRGLWRPVRYRGRGVAGVTAQRDGPTLRIEPDEAVAESVTDGLPPQPFEKHRRIRDADLANRRQVQAQPELAGAGSNQRHPRIERLDESRRSGNCRLDASREEPRQRVNEIENARKTASPCQR